MKYRRLDVDGDMLPSRGNPPFEGSDAVKAAVRSRILMFLGEWWETPDEGLDVSYFFGYQNEEKQRVAEGLLRQRIKETQGVVDILELKFGEITGGRRTISVVLITSANETITVEV